MTDKQGVCLSHRPCWCPLCSDYLFFCVYTAGVWAPCPPLVWVREGQSLLFLHPPTLPGEWMSHFIDHLLKASSGTRGENTIPQYWCPSYSPLPRTGRLFWRRVPQTSRLLILVSGFIGAFTVYPECSIPIHILSIVRKICYIQSICLSTETKHTIYPTLEIVSPNPDSSPPGSSLIVNSTCFNAQSPPAAPYIPAERNSPFFPLCSWNVCGVPLNLTSKHEELKQIL